MRLKCFLTLACLAAAATAAAPAGAREPSARKVAKMMGDCAYVVDVAESNGVQLNYKSQDWGQWLTRYAEENGFDAEQQVEMAKAKYRKRSRVLGADKTLSDMIANARKCDQQLEAI